MILTFRRFFETAGNFGNLGAEPGVVKVLQPNINSDYKLSYQGGNVLQPNQKIYYVIPEAFKGKVVRDMRLPHKKGPYGHGEPNMKWEPAKKKWRDYYGSYSRIELHDVNSNKWVAYRIEGKDYKHAEHRPDYEVETLHDWIGMIGKLSPDLVRIINPGNQRASTNPLSGEKVDPNDIKSSVEIGPVEIMYIPQQMTQGGNGSIQHVYSPLGYFEGQFTPAKFADYTKSANHAAMPSYPHYGIGYYPGALYLYGVPHKAERWLRAADAYKGKEKVHKHINIKHGGAPQKENMFIPGDKYYMVVNNVPLFSIKMDPMEGKGDSDVQVTREGKNQITIHLPQRAVGRKLLGVEVMCGDSEARPDRAEGTPGDNTGDESNKVRRGGAVLYTIFNGTNIGRDDVGPQMVASAHPNDKNNLISDGSKVQLRIEGDSTWVMGWRITYQ